MKSAFATLSFFIIVFCTESLAMKYCGFGDEDDAGVMELVAHRCLDNESYMRCLDFAGFQCADKSIEAAENIECAVELEDGRKFTFQLSPQKAISEYKEVGGE